MLSRHPSALPLSALHPESDPNSNPTATQAMEALLDSVTTSGEVLVSVLDRVLEDPAAWEGDALERLIDALGQAPLIDDRFGSRLLESEPDGGQADTRRGRFVERARILTAEAEVHLAKRIEFTRRRLERTVACSDAADDVRAHYFDAIETPASLRERPAGGCPTGGTGPIEARWDEYLAQRNELVESNVPLLERIALRYRTYGIPHSDLVQHGSLGLIRAVDKFDWRKNVRFRTYAELWIRQAIERATDVDREVIHVPRPVRQKLSKANRLHRASGSNRPLDPGRFAELTGLDRVTAARAFHIKSGISSLDSSVFDDGRPMRDDVASLDRAAADVTAEREHLRFRVRGLLRELPPREARVLNLRYGLEGGDPHTLEEVGQMMQISRERVRQLQMRALDHLRDFGADPRVEQVE